MFFRRRETAAKKRSVFATIGMITTLAILVLVPVLAVGFWLDWFDVSAEAKQGDWNVEIKVDPQQIKEDIETVNPPKPPLVQ